MTDYDNETPTHDSLRPLSEAKRPAGMKSTATSAGVANAFDHLEFAQSSVQDAVRGLIDRLGVILQPEEPSDVANGGTRGDRPWSEMAQLVHDHADRLEIFASYVRSVSARVDL